MCCCVPLRKLFLAGTIINIVIGLLYIYTIIPLIYTSFKKDEFNLPQQQPQTFIKALLYAIYFVCFLPIGCLLLCAILKKFKNWLKWSSLWLFVLQVYGTVVQICYQLMVNNMVCSSEPLKKQEKINPWKELFMQAVLIVVYLFTIFFYYREIEDYNPDQIAPSAKIDPQSFKYTNVLIYHNQTNQQSPLLQMTSQQQYPLPHHPHQQQQQQQQQQQHLNQTQQQRQQMYFQFPPCDQQQPRNTNGEHQYNGQFNQTSGLRNEHSNNYI